MSEGLNRIATIGDIPLKADEVHVWQASLDADPAAVERFSGYLSPVEKGRAVRFLSAKDGNRFTVCRGILRELLGGYLHCPANDVCLEAGAHGKPALRADTGMPDLRFNLSNSQGVAVYAFALGREVGIDIEKIRPDVAFQRIEDRYFSIRERQELRNLPEKLRPEGFFLCWTRKEAYIKARGDGLHLPLDSFDVSLTPGGAAVLNSQDRDRWSMYSLQWGADFAGALVVEGGEIPLKLLGVSSSAVGTLEINDPHLPE
jgi:4'-phosphopantetheinyl transferase